MTNAPRAATGGFPYNVTRTMADVMRDNAEIINSRWMTCTRTGLPVEVVPDQIGGWRRK